ncbi:MAG TPA: hypothetical protein VHM70_10445 [Polyangiaceae bacterium]|nr:hypothetical protein [Polyangiaceae bacterium]
MKLSSAREAQSCAVLALCLLGLGCERAAAPAEHAPAPAPAAVPREVMVAPQPAASGATEAWGSAPRASLVPEMRGKPVAMNSGEPCKTYRSLPSLHYSDDTLVQDACLAIPNDTKIEVRAGATLAIVATNGLMLGRNVVFDAVGARGHRGGRAPFASLSFDANSDAEIRSLCLDHGNQCACPSDASSLGAIRGHTGEAGSAGGSVRLIAGSLILPSKLTGLAIDVSGGMGGPAGESGTRRCVRGDLGCSSPVCSAGVLGGASGNAGNVSVVLGQAPSMEVAKHLSGATIPSDAAAPLIVESSSALLERTADLNRLALQEGWQRTAGLDTN